MVGKILELKEYSFFSIASMFSQISIFFATPIIITILPKLIKASEANDFQEKRKLFINFSLFIHIISIIICMICIFYANDIIALWIDQRTSIYISSFVKFHIIGSLLMTFQFVPFYLPIAMGHSQINAVSSFVSMIVYTCSLYIFIHKFMLIGASISWIILNSMGFLYSFYLIFRYLNYSVFKEWLIQLIIIPLVIAIFSFLPIYLLSNCVNFQFDYMFILNILISSILFIIGIIFYVKNKFPKIYSIVVLNLKISVK
jgi:O-antigen/teichoic acid export membrane protein